MCSIPSSVNAGNSPPRSRIAKDGRSGTWPTAIYRSQSIITCSSSLLCPRGIQDPKLLFHLGLALSFVFGPPLLSSASAAGPGQPSRGFLDDSAGFTGHAHGRRAVIEASCRQSIGILWLNGGDIGKKVARLSSLVLSLCHIFPSIVLTTNALKPAFA